jgi:hypothetical protein
MGYIRHHAIIVSSWNTSSIVFVHRQAKEMFPHISEVIPSGINGYMSFFIPPDGSKEGWKDSDDGDKRRRVFIELLNKQRYGDSSSNLDWVEVQYGDDDLENKVTHDSDEERRSGN